MTESLVPTVRTTPSTAEFIHAFLEASRDPSLGQKQLAVIWAQWALETGTGKNCYNWNLGNVKHVKGDGYDYMALKGVWEIVNGKRVELSPENPGSWFRSLPSLVEGMRDHIELIRDKKFKAAWPSILAGNPVEFAKQLRLRGYYTASLESYTNLMVANFRTFLKSTAWDDVIMKGDTSEDVRDPGWTTIYVEGEEYEVRRDYLGPMTIGQAVETARYFGCELPTKKMVDAIWQAADLKLEPITRSPENGLLKDYGASMFSKDTIADQLRRIEAQKAGKEYIIAAGDFKDVIVTDDGQVGIYGWHHLDGNPIQPVNTQHAFDHGDYSQGLRLFRKVQRIEVIHPDVPFEPRDYNG